MSNYINFHEDRQKALEMAQARMKRERVHYPLYNEFPTREEHLLALDRYGQMEAKYYVEALQQPSGPRPLALDNTKSNNKHEWAKAYYD